MVFRFYSRHGICQPTLQGKKLSADAAVTEPFQKTLEEYIEIEGFTLGQVYICDETGLCFVSSQKGP